jgi:uncharacterized RmlC-like cupin family protein
MKTIEITPAEMEQRISRYADLKPLKNQQGDQFPAEALDIVYARELLPVVGLEDGSATGITDETPIHGAGGMTITLARCPPGQGPGLHSHQKTFETFTVLKGRFEIMWGDDGSNTAVIDLFDTISVPPVVCRAFRNISDEEGLVQVIISGGVHDMNDIDFRPEIGEQVRRMSPELIDKMETDGMTFTAGQG